MTSGTLAAGLPVAVVSVAAVMLSLLTIGRADRSWAAVVVDSLAPPLTRIVSLGDRPLGPPLGSLELPPPGRGPPLGPAGPAGPAPVQDPAGHALRIQVEADAQAMAAVLGSQRVRWALEHRESLSLQLAESAVWQDLVTGLKTAP